MTFERIHANHQIRIEASPNEADLAIASIDNEGNLGQLNEFVLTQYGYSVEDLPGKQQLKDAGFGAIPNTKGKAILFVVTIDGRRDTRSNLERNLYNTLTEFRGWFRNKKLWLPLMGTGVGGLTLEESYIATVNAINRFQKNYPTEALLIISLPAIEKGRILYDALQHSFEKENTLTDDFLKEINCSFYLVGSIWGRDDQLGRFFEQGIWEKGHEDKTYTDIINGVRINDVLIVKSTFAADGISYLRVKALGTVVANLLDGAALSVEWKIRDISYDVENLGFYRNTIAEADTNDVRIILAHIDSSLWQKLLPASTTRISNPNSIAGLLSDSESGTDYLDITKDVTAFARVIAARSFEPPLAIALFGKWGSGKSFFMRELKEQIQRLSSSDPDQIYCSGIAHIHFNAWSYIDANLWASIVTRIFEGLHYYISKDSKAQIYKKEIEAALTRQLNITQDELQKLESQKDSLDGQIVKLNAEKSRIESKLNDKIQQIQSNTLHKVLKTVNERFNVQDKIQDSLNSNESYIKSRDELRKIIPERYWESPEQLYKRSKSVFTFIKDFVTGRRWWINLIWMAGILIIIFAVPGIVRGISHFLSVADFSLSEKTAYAISTAGILLVRIIGTYKRLQPTIAAFWKIKADYESERDIAVSEFAQKEKALKLQIEKSVSDIASINQQLKQATGLKAGLEYKIENALSTQALYSFIERRCNSEDYQKHLGIVSVIRKDFEILSELFSAHQSELINAEDKKEFISHFDKPLERIVLYIDDLDRCPEDIVVQVIDAVNLLMAYPLFIVVVGVDPHWIKNALIRKHTFQFTGRLNGHDDVEASFERRDPSSYLEKIFQVPFHLKDAPKEKVRDMIRSLAQVKPKLDTVVPAQNDYSADDLSTGSAMESLVPAASLASQVPGSVREKPEAIKISEDEMVLLQDVGEIIGENPRAIKRFINTYRIVKAHEDFSYDMRSEKHELLVIMFLLALPIGRYRKLLPSFEAYIENESNYDKKLNTYIRHAAIDQQEKDLKHGLDVLLSVKESYGILQQEPVGVFLKHNEFIKRFTFGNI